MHDTHDPCERFVVLRHEPAAEPNSLQRPLHWDLMLESQGVLWTWALDQAWKSSSSMVGKRLADHRLAYLEYEGPLTDGRGTVTRVDHGRVQWLDQSADRLEARLVGDTWQGRLTLTRGDSSADEWRMTLAESL